MVYFIVVYLTSFILFHVFFALALRYDSAIGEIVKPPTEGECKGFFYLSLVPVVNSICAFFMIMMTTVFIATHIYNYDYFKYPVPYYRSWLFYFAGKKEEKNVDEN